VVNVPALRMDGHLTNYFAMNSGLNEKHKSKKDEQVVNKFFN